ncbi:AMP-binding protein [Sphingobium sp. BHU LFT2]|uniref:AMP-binding protein n=1 Tax=Sphingobium sp. BHU LFT2 TaxID=2807634 RepID=UPI001BECD57C|nr:AMP-binding protein [Sphingobium sp. BHU LFT2]MBT2246741.1 AMP-binding protein [Sphingobium sp. BHU LFT2]
MTASYVSGCSDHPLLYQTIGAAFADMAVRHGDRDAIIVRHQGVCLSYAQLAAKVDAFASGLLAIGLEPGDRVGIWSPNNLEWVVTQLATAKAGLILVNINPAYRIAELDYCLNKVGCRALIFAQRFKTSDYGAMIADLVPEAAHTAPGALRAARLPDLQWLIAIGEGGLAGALPFNHVAAYANVDSDAVLAALADRLQPEDPINIQFTSGTTGSPKGATLSHHNILNNGLHSGRRMLLSEQDRMCIPVPLYHCFGMVLGVLACITHGACMVFPGEAFDPGVVLQCVAEESCTALHGVPTMFIAQLDHPDFPTFDLSSLRTGIMAGAPCPVEVMERVIAQMHMRDITIGYGMTEVSPLSFQTMPEDSLERRVETVGRVHDFVEAKIVDSRGRVVPRGEQGEILFRGYSLMNGYWDDAERTAEAIDPRGWIHSGDLATMDAEGYVRITGRTKDMIIRGGENIYPREIEEFLHRHVDVQEAQVFGIPDSHFGEKVCVWIRSRNPDLTEDAIREYCRGQIAHYKIPQYVRFVAEFPMTATGKVQKFVMRDIMSAEQQA